MTGGLVKLKKSANLCLQYKLYQRIDIWEEGEIDLHLYLTQTMFGDLRYLFCLDIISCALATDRQIRMHQALHFNYANLLCIFFYFLHNYFLKGITHNFFKWSYYFIFFLLKFNYYFQFKLILFLFFVIALHAQLLFI